MSDPLRLLLAYASSVVLLVHVLELPQKIVGNRQLVNEYYTTHMHFNFVMEYFIVMAYLWISNKVADMLGAHGLVNRLTTTALVTAGLTAGACMYFRAHPIDSTFFSRWFHTVGYTSVIYDVIILVLIQLIYLHYL